MSAPSAVVADVSSRSSARENVAQERRPGRERLARDAVEPEVVDPAHPELGEVAEVRERHPAAADLDGAERPRRVVQRQDAVEPAGPQRAAGRRGLDLRHRLEVRAVRFREPRRVDDGECAGVVQALEPHEGGVQGERGVELEPHVRRDGDGRAQPGEVRVADGRDGGQPVEPAAQRQDDERVAGVRRRGARERDPGRERVAAERREDAGHDPAPEHAAARRPCRADARQPGAFGALTTGHGHGNLRRARGHGSTVAGAACGSPLTRSAGTASGAWRRPSRPAATRGSHGRSRPASSG